MTRPQFSRKGEAPTAKELALMAEAMAERWPASVWMVIAQRLGAVHGAVAAVEVEHLLDDAVEALPNEMLAAGLAPLNALLRELAGHARPDLFVTPRGLPLVPVAVNISALQFRRADFVDGIAAALRRHDIPAGLLTLELTESIVMRDVEQVARQLAELKALGVSIAIDDFGTGYSSLAYLKRFPLDKLKIDRSFVMDTPQSADDVAIVTAIIQMGHSLQLKTVAEGVETVEQKELLHRLGCDLVQGFLVSAPMDAQATQRWLSPQG